MPVGYRKTGGFDDMGRHVQARAEPKNRSRILGDVGLEKRNLHFCDGPPASHEMSE
jgi:hypothetical protein